MSPQACLGPGGFGRTGTSSSHLREVAFHPSLSTQHIAYSLSRSAHDPSTDTQRQNGAFILRPTAFKDAHNQVQDELNITPPDLYL